MRRTAMLLVGLVGLLGCGETGPRTYSVGEEASSCMTTKPSNLLILAGLPPLTELSQQEPRSAFLTTLGQHPNSAENSRCYAWTAPRKTALSMSICQISRSSDHRTTVANVRLLRISVICCNWTTDFCPASITLR